MVSCPDWPARRLGRSIGLSAALVASAFAPAVSADPLTDGQAVERAVAANPDLRAADSDLVAARKSVESAEGDRQPVFFADVGGNVTERMRGSQNSVSRSISRGLDADAGVRYTTDIGTNLEFGWTTGVAWGGSTIDPFGEDTGAAANIDGQIYARATQPLLRGAGTDSVLSSLRQAESSRTQAERQHDKARQQLVLDVLNAYDELWYAQQAVGVEEEALALADRQKAEADQRASALGTQAAIDTLAFSTALATQRQSLADARATVRVRAIDLGRLLAMRPFEAMGIEAVSPPADPRPLPPLDDLLQAARDGSPDIAAARAQVESARIALESAAANDRPKLDLSTTVSMSGLWLEGSSLGAALPDNRPAFAASLGLSLELPIGGGRQGVDHERAAAQLEAAEARYQARLDELDSQVASQSVSFASATEQTALAGEVLEAAKAQAAAERDRLQLGTSVTTDLIKAQQQERDSELRQLRAIVSRAETRLQLEFQSGTLLERYAAYFRQVRPE